MLCSIFLILKTWLKTKFIFTFGIKATPPPIQTPKMKKWQSCFFLLRVVILWQNYDSISRRICTTLSQDTHFVKSCRSYHRDRCICLKMIVSKFEENWIIFRGPPKRSKFSWFWRRLIQILCLLRLHLCNLYHWPVVTISISRVQWLGLNYFI